MNFIRVVVLCGLTANLAFGQAGKSNKAPDLGLTAIGLRDSKAFSARLLDAGFYVKVVRVFVPGYSGGRHALWIARSRVRSARAQL